MIPSIFILLPAYNEADHIADIVVLARGACEGARVVVVDDGSDDGTGERALAAGAVVLRLPFNMGYGVALQTGYKYALRQGADILVQLDSDGQHDPAHISAVLSPVRRGDFDLCIGSRFLEGETYAIPPLRRAGMALFRRVASRILGCTITDPTSGYQAMNRRVIAFFTGDGYPTDYPDTDVLVMLHRHGFRIAEVPVAMEPSKGVKTIHGGLRPLYYVFKMSLSIPLNLLRKEN